MEVNWKWSTTRLFALFSRRLERGVGAPCRDRNARREAKPFSALSLLNGVLKGLRCFGCDIIIVVVEEYFGNGRSEK